jgi:two-component system chemotaxis response regulator CheB
MQNHDLIVIGGSAGSVDALEKIVSGLPAGLPAAICIVVHTTPYAPHRLPEVLRRCGPLPVHSATQGALLEQGAIFVAPPDEHLIINDGRLRLTHGPKENRTRPAIDPLFRSAALQYGPRVLGVVLSGALDDATAGLWTVKDRGGIAIVQDPADALIAGMPRSAIAHVAVDYVVPATEIGPLLARLANTPVASESITEPRGNTDDLEREVAVALDENIHWKSERYGVPSRFACPDCGGVLWASTAAGPRSFRCEVGHAYSSGTLAEEHHGVVERALWAAVRALEDKAELAALRAAEARDRGDEGRVQRLSAEREAAQGHARAIRVLLRADGRSGAMPKESADSVVSASEQ